MKTKQARNVQNVCDFCNQKNLTDTVVFGGRNTASRMLLEKSGPLPCFSGETNVRLHPTHPTNEIDDSDVRRHGFHYRAAEQIRQWPINSSESNDRDVVSL